MPAMAAVVTNLVLSGYVEGSRRTSWLIDWMRRWIDFQPGISRPHLRNIAAQTGFRRRVPLGRRHRCPGRTIALLLGTLILFRPLSVKWAESSAGGLVVIKSRSRGTRNAKGPPDGGPLGFGESGTDLLSRGIPRTIIGAAPFHGPVRDGKEWFQSAMGTRHNSSPFRLRGKANSGEVSLVVIACAILSIKVIGSSRTGN